MIRTSFFAALLFLAVATIACRSGGGDQKPPILQPGAPGHSTREVSAAQAADLSKVKATEADVKFMQGMIGHHAQAVEMVELLRTRTVSEDMKKLAHRIELSQIDEINMMKAWLTARGAALPDEHAHHKPGAHLMPGMLTPEDMAKLAAAKGSEFDRLFLQYMIKHHDGALVMVKELFATPGAAQESDIFAFASDVEADQSMEMDRMSAMLATIKERW